MRQQAELMAREAERAALEAERAALELEQLQLSRQKHSPVKPTPAEAEEEEDGDGVMVLRSPLRWLGPYPALALSLPEYAVCRVPTENP